MWLGRRSVLPIIVLLSTTRFLKCVLCNADHWQNDGVESLLDISEQFRGRTRRHFSISSRCRTSCKNTISARVCPKKREVHVKLSKMHADMSDPWVTFEINVSPPPRSASQNLARKRLPTEIPARKQLSPLERATRAKLRRSAFESCLATSRIRRAKVTKSHSYSSSSPSSACSPTSDSEARPNFDIVLINRDAMIDCFCPDLTQEQPIEADETYEMLLTLGADMSVARTTVAGFLLLRSSVSLVCSIFQDMCWT